MYRGARISGMLLVLVGSACDQRTPTPAVTEVATPTTTLEGVDPDTWHCDLIAKPAEVAAILGGPVRQVDSAIDPPSGTPRPCNYLTVSSVPEAWTFDLDCRRNALRTADVLWRQYGVQTQALIDAVADARKEDLEDDAGVIHGPPSPAVEVAVGARGLDHNGMALLFIDDDTPCYGRIVGPDAVRRLALAQLVAKNLRPATAPMDPRAAGKR
jgi:hypothetical protein